VEIFIQPKITGYRQLTENDALLINKIKELAVQAGDLVQELKAQGGALDQRWVSIGTTDLQTGFMALVRSVAQPTTF
jgi:hypothetical protein